jgi:EAL domain-containing protein (putative c-di-GMP-specific phosphodiesterase class I)
MAQKSDTNPTMASFTTVDESILRLHSLLEIVPLLEHFADWSGRSVDFGEMQYSHHHSDLFEIVTRPGSRLGAECTIHSLPNLGHLYFLRASPFSVAEQETLAQCASVLQRPLTNALRYHAAVRQCDRLTQRLSISEKTCTSLSLIDSGDQHLPLEELVSHNELQHALHSEALTVFYQPKVDLKTGEVRGLEALVRWHHADKGLLSPDQFIPLAERYGLIPQITRWVLNAVLRQCAHWQQQEILVPIAVNLSGLDLEDTALPDYLAQLLEAWAIPAAFLELEITETAAFGDHQRSMATLQRLSELGVAVAIDDFGIGYSSLDRLKHLPVNTIKIDKSFVMEEGRGEHDLLFVDTITRLGHQLGMKIVAEGVDSHESLQRLRETGCDMVQGYHISYPLSGEATTGWLSHSAQKTGVAHFH